MYLPIMSEPLTTPRGQTHTEVVGTIFPGDCFMCVSPSEYNPRMENWSCRIIQATRKEGVGWINPTKRDYFIEVTPEDENQ